MARNHRGFVEALIAANRIGADVLLLNTSFAGPALAEVVQREGVDAVIYDEEFTDHRRPRAGRQTGRDADHRLDRRAPGWADGREDDRRARRAAAAAGEHQEARSSCSRRVPPEVPRAPSTPAVATAAPASSRRFWIAPHGAPKSPS